MSFTRFFYQLTTPEGIVREYATQGYADLMASRTAGTVAPIYRAQSRTSDKKYLLVYQDGHWICPCTGYGYRETCYHCDEATAATGLADQRQVH